MNRITVLVYQLKATNKIAEKVITVFNYMAMAIAIIELILMILFKW